MTRRPSPAATRQPLTISKPLLTVSPRPLLVALVSLTIFATSFATSCGSNDSSAASDTGGGTGDSTVGIGLADVWVRPTPPGADSTAFYLTVTNESDIEDQLTEADSSRCETSELHVSSNDDGVMSMSPADPEDLTVAPAGRLVLEPGGLHVMCLGVTEPLAEGDMIDLTLRFEQAGPVSTQAIVASP